MKQLRIGMIGLDTSHCPAFAGILNSKDNPYHVPGGQVVAAVVGGNQDLPMSRDRLEMFTKQLVDDHGVKLYESISEMAGDVDAILLESADGAQHAEQFAQAAPAGKCVFIDKPLACSVADAKRIAELSAKHDAPVMSCSAIRYAAGIADLRKDEPVFSCEAFGPATLLEGYPGLFWYGVHSAELLFSFMGGGCQTVQTIGTDGTDEVVGTWADGRIGTLRGLRKEGLHVFGCTVYDADSVRFSLALGDPPFYSLMLKHIMQFFQTRTSPIDMAETLEIVTFLEAANRSKELGGKEISLASL